MADVRPFRALRPRPDLAERVIALPYDVPTYEECKHLTQERLCFLRVTRSEVDLPEGADAHGAAAYAQARDTLQSFVSDGTLIRDEAPHYYLYGQRMGDHVQVGILAACSTDAYDAGSIKKHEYTRPDKEDDRTEHMQVLDAQVGLVFLAFRANMAVAEAMAAVTQHAPDWRVTTEDGVEHTFWVAPTEHTATLRAAMAGLDTLYIADGHHRSAAASRVAAVQQTPASRWFVAGLFPDDALFVMAYNRVVHDLNGLDEAGFLAAVDATFDRAPAAGPVPEQRGTVTMFFQGTWQTLTPKPGVVNHDDPVARLDAAVLQDHLLQPVLGIDDPRRSTRIHFVGGIRGHEALEAAVHKGAAVAFHLYPTGLDQLFDVADAGEVMPPKSTWFEPKLREGVVVRQLADLPTAT